MRARGINPPHSVLRRAVCTLHRDTQSLQGLREKILQILESLLNLILCFLVSQNTGINIVAGRHQIKIDSG